MPYHNYFCYVISNKFPRLLAEREIIANAFFTNDVMHNVMARHAVLKVMICQGFVTSAKLQK